MTDAISERDRRLSLWHSLSNERLDDIEPQRLRDLGIYGGAQGIWVDKAHTASPEIGTDGATVAILHMGRHYADDLSEDGVIYHYPTTSRPPARDAAEVQATKNAMNHRLPIFVILPGKLSQHRRSLRLGWVCDFDDEKSVCC
jgi:putative restriction endonuclease